MAGGGLMGALRAAWRLAALAALTVFFYLLLLAGLLANAGSRRRGGRWRGFCFRNWSRALLAVMNARVEQRGSPPAPPFFLVANHLSYVDVLVLASRVDAVFIAKSEVAGWPVIGRLCRSVGTLFVDRELRRDLPRVIAEIDAELARGEGVVLFPEGTSTAGAGVGPFRPALLEVAARTRQPVSYATLGYRTPATARPAHLAVCWWGEMGFTGHLVKLLALPGFDASLVFGDEAIHEPDRKRLATRLRRAIDRHFVPVVDRAGEVA